MERGTLKTSERSECRLRRAGKHSHVLPTIFTSHSPPFNALPTSLACNVRRMQGLNAANFQLKYYDDKELAAFLATFCHEIERLCAAVSMLVSGAGRADVFRLLRMYVLGGTWFDSDLGPLDIRKNCTSWKLIPSSTGKSTTDSLVLYRYDGENRPRYTLMSAYRSRHPILAATLSIIANNILREHANGSKATRGAVLVTGPVNLHRAICMGGFAPRSSCGANLVRYSRGEGIGTHFGGKAAAPLGVYGEGTKASFRYAACAFPGNLASYQRDMKRMGVVHHLRSIARAR